MKPMSLTPLFSPDHEQNEAGPTDADLKSAKKSLTTRRTFLKAAAATGAVAAMYTVPKISSVHSRPAYAGVTGEDCPPDFCVAPIISRNSDGSPNLGSPMFIPPIEFPGTITDFYNYGNTTGSSAVTDGASANTPGLNLVGSGAYQMWKGIEEVTYGATTNSPHGNIAMFALVVTEGDGKVHLVTILDTPDDNSGGEAIIKYTGLPTGTSWSVADDPGEPAHYGTGVGHDADNLPPNHPNTGAGLAHTASPPMAVMDVRWLECCTDGGVLTPTLGNPFDCETKICVEFKRHVNIAGSNPICFLYQDTKHHDDWLTGGGIDGPYDGAFNDAAPKVRLRELGNDFCILGNWP